MRVDKGCDQDAQSMRTVRWIILTILSPVEKATRDNFLDIRGERATNTLDLGWTPGLECLPGGRVLTEVDCWENEHQWEDHTCGSCTHNDADVTTRRHCVISSSRVSDTVTNWESDMTVGKCRSRNLLAQIIASGIAGTQDAVTSESRVRPKIHFTSRQR